MTGPAESKRKRSENFKEIFRMAQASSCLTSDKKCCKSTCYQVTDLVRCISQPILSFGNV